MPLKSLQFRAGVNREGTTLANEGGWYECDKIRFRSGYPQKLGGWKPLSSNTFLGIARSLWNWVTLQGYNLLGIGTNVKYYIESGEVYNDITPIRYTSTVGSVTFAATNGSSVVRVTDVNHGAISGDYVTFSGAVSLGGNVTAAVLNAEYVITYINSDSYSITVPVTANASDVGNGGSNAFGRYQINIGLATYGTQAGWGAGYWGGTATNGTIDFLNGTINSSVTTIVVVSTTGFGATGTILIDSELITYSGKTSTNFTGCVRGVSGTTAAAHTTGATVYDALTFNGWGQAASSAVGTQLRLWSQASYGEYLIINPRNGALYLWVPEYSASNVLTVNRAVELSIASSGIYQTDIDCPAVASQVMVSDGSRFVIAFGVNGLSTDPDPFSQKPMLVRWSDQEDYAKWTPAITNQAGGFQLSSGSTIVSAIQTRQEILVLTDSALYSMQYLGPPFVWGFNILSNNISIIGPNAITVASNITYWMGADKFYVYTGRVDTLPCTLRQYVFGDINKEQAYQIFAGQNEAYSEVWWYYCSAGSTVVDRYVIYNYLDKIWYYGNLSRSAWLDSPLREFPMAATYNHSIVYHEDGTNDEELSGEVFPITSYIQSSDFDLEDGHNYGFVWRVIPDITFDGSTTPAPLKPEVTFSVRPRYNPGAPYGTADTPTVASTQSYNTERNYLVQEFTEIVYTRVRGRQMAFKVSSNQLGCQWQLGMPKIDIRPDGRR